MVSQLILYDFIIYYSTLGSSTGSVYLYKLRGDKFTLTNIIHSNGFVSNFGISLDIYNDKLIVGASGFINNRYEPQQSKALGIFIHIN